MKTKNEGNQSAERMKNEKSGKNKDVKRTKDKNEKGK